MALTACSTGSNLSTPTPATSSPLAPKPSVTKSIDSLPPANIDLAPSPKVALNPTTPVSVTVSAGTIASVSMVNAAGRAVTGALAADRTTWKSDEDLGYAKQYTVSVVAVNARGARTEQKTAYTTVAPANQTMATLERIGGYSLQDGATYGVGIVPVVHFDEAITDKAAAQKTLTITTTPHVDGSWYWADNQNVHWRPMTYWAPGTKVSLSTRIYGVQVSPGLYGQADSSASFVIGAKHVSVADDKTHQVSVYFNDKLVRTMPTSMGEHTGIQLSTGYISFFTMDGMYTVLEHDNPAMMSSASYGLPASAPGGYEPEAIYWATKISTDGIYLHELTTTIWAQGNTDVSHGCLNLNTDNARWYFNSSQIGDVVEIKNNGGPTIDVWQGGDWSVPWDRWTAGSAL